MYKKLFSKLLFHIEHGHNWENRKPSGKINPLFKGELGAWDGVVLHNVSKTDEEIEAMEIGGYFIKGT